MRRFKTSPDESYEKVQSVNLKRITLNNSLITGVDFVIPERPALIKKTNQLFLEKAPLQLAFSQQTQKKQKHVVYIRKGNSRNREKGIMENVLGRVCRSKLDKTIALHTQLQWNSEKIKIYSYYQPKHEEFHLLNRPYFMGESITLQKRSLRLKEKRVPKIYQSQRMKKEQSNPFKYARPLAISQQSAKINRSEMISPWHDLE